MIPNRIADQHFLPLPLLFERRATKLSYKLKVILLKPGFIVNKMEKKIWVCIFPLNMYGVKVKCLCHILQKYTNEMAKLI